jgi:DNA-binding MurR/RpiR family transcriptional regulator
LPETAAPPRDFEALREALAEHGHGLPKRLRQVAEFALRHPDDIAFGTAAGVAQAAEVQPSTLVRFAQALGYTGFSDLQALFRDRLRGGDHARRIDRIAQERPAMAAPGGLLGFIDAALVSLQRLQREHDPAALEAAVERLAAARLIRVIGMRRMYGVAASVSYAFASLGVRAEWLQGAGGMGLGKDLVFLPGEALLAFSFTPYAAQTIEVASAAQAAGAPIVAITDSALSPLKALATLTVEVVETDFAGFRSVAATQALAMALVTGIAQRRRAGKG